MDFKKISRLMIIDFTVTILTVAIAEKVKVKDIWFALGTRNVFIRINP